ncbi:GNAT family N-acetyltransferase [Dactylosporangium sp. NPDC005572]|uniref:GNAT family N-acetyltransferase n=1 Tax=Dactylosporangium sp. NPDC005572 TaxID=3156889 RepID=UPI0033A698CF
MSETYPVLARELRDLPQEILDVAGPPVPMVDPPYRIRAAEPNGPDTAMITAWMNQPHLAAAWEYDWPEERWYAHLRAQVDGTYSLPLIAEFNDTPIAYLEIYRTAKDQIAGTYDADPYDLGMHAAIAVTSMVNKGLGPRLLPQLIRSIFELEPKCRRVVFEPDYRNAVMRRLSAFGGGVFLGEHYMRADRKVALYVVPRTPDDLPSFPLPEREPPIRPSAS